MEPIKTNVVQFINKTSELKTKADKKGFNQYIDSISMEEWQDIKEFATVLKNLAESQIAIDSGIRALAEMAEQAKTASGK